MAIVVPQTKAQQLAEALRRMIERAEPFVSDEGAVLTEWDSTLETDFLVALDDGKVIALIEKPTLTLIEDSRRLFYTFEFSVGIYWRKGVEVDGFDVAKEVVGRIHYQQPNTEMTKGLRFLVRRVDRGKDAEEDLARISLDVEIRALMEDMRQ